MKNKSIKKEDKYMINIYRTKEYIVEQKLKYHYLPDGSFTLFSIDTYHLRTKKSDIEYEKLYSFKDNLESKRIYAGAYVRKYVY